jgi:ABC-type glycerol-3-phosphate transport system substrate-binding protein
MKKTNVFFALTFGLILLASFGFAQTTAKPQAPAATNFEIVMPWGTDHERGKIIRSMIGNHSTLGTKYNFTYTAVGGGPSDRDALVARFLAGDYPNLILATQDWYTEFAEFNIWYDFSDDIAAWTGDRAGWQADIPAGWWSILDKTNGDGSGDDIFALPFFGQSILPYINLNDFEDAGLTEADVDTLDKFMAAAETLDGAGKTPYGMVGMLQSDLAYMNYMFGSTDNFIDSASDPASVFSWGSEDQYGVNGSLNVEGFAAYLKLKGEGWVPTTVDTDGGGQVNDAFGAGNTSMALCGPWGTSIFMGAGLGASDFKAVPMPKTSDGVRSTITGGGISFVPTVTANATELADAVELAQWLLDDENQMKTVDNWLGSSWRIPVRQSLKNDPWFTASGHPERANFVTHIESQVYAFPWGKQHPEWLTVHSSVMMPGYRNALLDVEHGKGYTDAWYTEKAQSTLDEMAVTIQCYYLGGPCVELEEPAASAPGFEFLVGTLAILGVAILATRKRR